MSLTLETTDGSLEFSDTWISAIARRADFVATLTAEAIRAALKLSPPPHGQVHRLNVPAGFLLELGAVLVLDMWERDGITAHRDAGFPTAREADGELVRRLNDDPTQFDRVQSATLSRRVLRFWVENFAWDGVETFGTDMVLSTADEDAFVDAVARFLFDNRNALRPLLPNEENQS
jgi:hypothetical protein